MAQLEITDALRSASMDVLETMFFADAVPIANEDATPQSDARACELQCSGGESGSFSVVVDRVALQMLCCAFYGQEGDVSPTQEEDLICELTNMLAGSTLSRYAPARSCILSSPRLCDYASLAATVEKDIADRQESVTRLSISIEGGLLLLSCTLRRSA
jgi:hypothetical protein